MVILTFALGLILLIGGAELLVRGASRLAAAWGIAPLLIGLTVVAWGTSAPELAVALRGVWAGQPDVAVGNVVGSNICNVLLILGLTALVCPLVVTRRLVHLEIPILIAASVVTLLLALDGTIGRLDAFLLLAGGVGYTLWAIWISGGGGPSAEVPEAADPRRAPVSMLLVLIFIGLMLLVLGAHLLVDAAVHFARALGVSELVIGLTVVAAGTSLPEIATSVLAALRGERDIAVGNAIGSSLSNLLLILGVTGLLAPQEVPVAGAAIAFDLPVMLATAVACLPIFFTNHCIDRWEGAVFLGYYAAYTLYLILNAAQHAALPMYSQVMLAFVIPITVATLAALALHAWTVRGSPHAPPAPAGEGPDPPDQ
jgi:cation:H+ antiporter